MDICRAFSFPLNKEVSRENAIRLGALSTPSVRYHSYDAIDSAYRKKHRHTSDALKNELADLSIPVWIDLKVGGQFSSSRFHLGAAADAD